MKNELEECPYNKSGICEDQNDMCEGCENYVKELEKAQENTFYSIFKDCDTDKAVNYSNAYEESFAKIRKDIKLIWLI